jgi:hypothetical protein
MIKTAAKIEIRSASRWAEECQRGRHPQRQKDYEAAHNGSKRVEGYLEDVRRG